MKKFLIVILLFGCELSGSAVIWDDTAMYELGVSEDQTFYFQYPLAATVSEENGEGEIDYQNCKVKFDKSTELDVPESAAVRTRQDSGKRFEAWYLENLVVFYGGYSEKAGYVFWVYRDGEDVSDCVDMVDGIVTSFIDEPVYLNDKYSFRSGLLPEYKLEYLPSGEGILMKKWVENEDEDGYVVEISVYGFENLMEWKDVMGYMADKYTGYSSEFVSYNDSAGIFVDEGSVGTAVRHYFIMGKGSDYLIEAYMKVPSVRYNEHKAEFDDFVKTIEVF
ncbi:MAG: hypothetical protein ABIH78_00440 [Candidatus Peregrinibacteria bacterium]